MTRLVLNNLSWLARFRGFRPTAVMAELGEQDAPAAKRPCMEDEPCEGGEPGSSPETPPPVDKPRPQSPPEDQPRPQSPPEDTSRPQPPPEGKPRPQPPPEDTSRSARRKCVLLLSYSGKGYMGMQWNPGVPTIEEDLLAALIKAGAAPEGFDLSKLQFQRCARTDKGVSAARQVVSLKPGIEERINAHLPPQIRVMGMKRVTKSFNSKNKCTARSYEYLLPTYAFAPYRLTTLKYRIDEDTVTQVQGLLQQYVGTHNFHNFTSGKKFEEPQSKRYMMSFECGEPFQSHGQCGTCAEKKEAEFIPLRVKGQSFMQHQIRKMIGLVIAVVRGYTPGDTIIRAFDKNKIDIPRVPGLGLLLDNVHFDGYNRKFGGDGLHESLDWSDIEDKLQAFKMEHIYRSIIDTEINELSMMQWLGSLQIHDFSSTRNRLQQQEKEQAAVNTDSNPIEKSEQQESASSSNSGDHGGGSTKAGGGGERGREDEMVVGGLDTTVDTCIQSVSSTGEGGGETPGGNGSRTTAGDTSLRPETTAVSSDSQAGDYGNNTS